MLVYRIVDPACWKRKLRPDPLHRHFRRTARSPFFGWYGASGASADPKLPPRLMRSPRTLAEHSAGPGSGG